MEKNSQIAELIRGIGFEGEILSDSADLISYENDTSLFEVKPALAVKPKNIDDIKKIVSLVSNKKAEDPSLSLTARAAGTGMAGGALNDSIIVDVANLNHIKSTTVERAVVEPGVFYRDMDAETQKLGVIMPSFPASRSLCAVGGMTGTNASGEMTLSYGSTENWVKRLRVVLSDGNEYEFGPLTLTQLEEKKKLQNFEGDVYRRMHELLEKNYDLIRGAKPNVAKNSTGYALWNIWDKKTFDLTKLFTGSEGTLGIFTEIEFALIKPKQHRKLVVIFLKDFDKLSDVVTRVLAHKPETFESYDDHTFQFAIRFFPDIVKSLKTGIIKLGLSFIPEAIMVLKGGFPKLVLLAEFTGDSEEEADQKANTAFADLKQFKVQIEIMRTQKDAEKFWTIRHESFNLLRKHGGSDKTAPFIDDIIVSPEKLPEFLPKLSEVMKDYKLTYTIAGHIGDGNLHIIPLMNLRNENDRDIVMELSQKVFDLVFSFGGSMSAEHNDGLVRTAFLRQMYGDKVYSLFEETKNIFDPKNIFNPGKKVYGHDLEYIKDHIDKVY
ncbi:MAG: Oxidoreductase [Parcubacteria group bacterium GW2011_GWC1_42_11]|uniref:Oxidoreductase n=1 Tax=Candidatus Nomurabacteria bacterium GW2011_GWC2_42_20 TaxID=1618756 RepID=A0A0G1CCJ8_9BACT|nr:MAG: Oxidoreductase [Parcubacteria group bacterium GW2011_GWC1_42_11]KKS47368.1 MAG: Oxidoreductase [Candidatus Nomurabacteria bacterium GW2011_GWC2_42_20]KKT09331.1 MAG: Oxidoreductase [Candidatus Nomurabacteria bacterium GW2011_GWB1_43_20]TAN35748.1 MAG: FAD-binding oxidoreductase [Patescibacteria group bacterium]HBH71580.1 FAD-binding oxidoreductase [Candidatus Yonathbacteria bacterium]